MKSFKKKTVSMKKAKNVQSKVNKSKFKNFFSKEYFSTYENFSFSNTSTSSVNNNVFNYFM